MSRNSDSEYEYEEAVVLVELNGIIDSNFLLQEQTPTKILGIDTEKPILQIGHYIFAGDYEDTLGSVIAYEPTTTVNSEEKEIQDYKFICKTDKKISMKRIFLQDKESSKTDDSKEHHSDMNKELQEFKTNNVVVDDIAMDCTSSLIDGDITKQ